ncbi:PRANC domain protein [Fusarium subglutinans]|uniref:PRANC domain protein n=1 Tax=Gibberella subglutinans TaxID=42677 RepID=A0A8H5Q9W9_GIBSU|nr:PRANC domain protein [Fusarium subglutinans]KAF5611876.1 PRANC domain protein [Fusarium subglutinans]
MAIDSKLWNRLSPANQNEVIGLLPILGGKCSQLATVSRAWRSIIEPLNFAEISLTVPRLTEPNSQAILVRKRNQIRYIWFRVELKRYDCTECESNNQDRWGLDAVDNQFIVNAFHKLFRTLSAWEPRGDLVLDISVYSPSDNQHWFKYISFYSDTDTVEPSHHGHEHGVTVNDPAHGWVVGQPIAAPSEHTIDHVFDEIMGEGPFPDDETEFQWWRSLPRVPVVGVVLFRQQTRRRWKPLAIANMLTRFPNIKEVCYEPWRELGGMDLQTDKWNQKLIESFPQIGSLCKLTIFENVDQSYPEIYRQTYPGIHRAPAIRVPSQGVSQGLARTSQHLEMLSASFMADASLFFAAPQIQYSGTWSKLTSLALTSNVLTGDADPQYVSDMLQNAAYTALKMPRLNVMELWNGRKGVAMLFRYQRPREDGEPAVITVRGTSELALETTVVEAWDLVAYRHGHSKVAIQTSSIDPNEIKSHGDAICQLGLLTEVTRPVSLRQIINENSVSRARPLPPPPRSSYLEYRTILAMIEIWDQQRQQQQ